MKDEELPEIIVEPNPFHEWLLLDLRIRLPGTECCGYGDTPKEAYDDMAQGLNWTGQLSKLVQEAYTTTKDPVEFRKLVREALAQTVIGPEGMEELDNPDHPDRDLRIEIPRAQIEREARRKRGEGFDRP